MYKYVQVCIFDVGNLLPLQVGSVPWWAPNYHGKAGGHWMQFIAGIEMPKLICLRFYSIWIHIISLHLGNVVTSGWGFKHCYFFETLKSNLKKVKPRKSKDRTLPKKVVENPLLMWIILKTILCLLLDIQGKSNVSATLFLVALAMWRAYERLPV